MKLGQNLSWFNHVFQHVTTDHDVIGRPCRNIVDRISKLDNVGVCRVLIVDDEAPVFFACKLTNQKAVAPAEVQIPQVMRPEVWRQSLS